MGRQPSRSRAAPGFFGDFGSLPARRSRLSEPVRARVRTAFAASAYGRGPMDDQLPALSVIGVPTKRTRSSSSPPRPIGGASPGWPARASTATWRCAARWPTSRRGSRSGRASSRSTTATRPRWRSRPGTSPRSAAVASGSGSASATRPAMDRLGLATGKPLSDIRDYVEGSGPPSGRPGSCRRSGWPRCATRCSPSPSRSPTARSGPTPRSRHMADAARPTSRPTGATAFALANMAPTVIDADKDAARAIHRRTLTGYVTLPNYRNYWKAAGYEDEMAAIEDAIAAGDRDKLPALMTDEWVDDCTISGSAGEVRERLAAWYDARCHADRRDVVDDRRPGPRHRPAVRALRILRPRTTTMTIALTKDSIDIGIVVKDADAALGVLPRHARLRGHRLDADARRRRHDVPPAVRHDARQARRAGRRAARRGAARRDPGCLRLPLLDDLGRPTSTRSPTRCAGAGRKVVVEPREIRPGVRISMVEDPDGNWVEFLEVTPQG